MTLLDDILHDLLSPTAPGRALLCADRCPLGAPRVPGPCAPRLLWALFQNCPWCGRLRLKHVKSSFWGSGACPPPLPRSCCPSLLGQHLLSLPRAARAGPADNRPPPPPPSPCSSSLGLPRPPHAQECRSRAARRSAPPCRPTSLRASPDQQVREARQVSWRFDVCRQD